MGSTGTPARNQQKFYDRAQRAIAALAKHVGRDVSDVENQVHDEAKKRGAVIPWPGKDY